MDAYAVVKRPVITEKSHFAMEEDNTYTFDVAMEATKEEIREAVEALWGVQVTSVRTAVIRGKRKRYRWRHVGFTRNWKKAMVRLAEGQAIDELR
jgi:large subunit ribosomal protein L23